MFASARPAGRTTARGSRRSTPSGVRSDGSTTMKADGRPVFGSFFGQSSFATHALAYEDNVVVVGSEVDLSVAAPFGCGVQTGAGTVMNVLELDERSSLVVFGAGGVGLPAVMAARALGVSTIVVVDPVPSRRRLAAELGAIVVLDPQVDDVVEAVRDHTGGGATSAIETTAIGDVLLQALDCLGARGTCVALGVGTPELRLGMERLSRGRSLRTTIEGDSDPARVHPQAPAASRSRRASRREAHPDVPLRRVRTGDERRRVRRDDQAGARPLAPGPLRPPLLGERLRALDEVGRAEQALDAARDRGRARRRRCAGGRRARLPSSAAPTAASTRGSPRPSVPPSPSGRRAVPPR